MGVPYKGKYVFLPGDRYLALIGVKICMMVGPMRWFLHFWFLVEISLGISKLGGGVKNGTFCTIYFRRIVVAVL